MKCRLHRIVCLLTVFVVLFGINISPSFAAKKESESQNMTGIMSSAYGYALNDLISNYGVVSTAEKGEVFAAGDEAYMYPGGGVVYADLIDFNQDNNPCLVVYLVDKIARKCEVHIMRFDKETKEVQEIGVISKPYDIIAPGESGEMSIGYDEGKSYISYKHYKNQVLQYSEYYTVIGNDAFMFVKTPTGISDTGIMDFNSEYFHSNMDISYYNKTLGDFFKKLKDTTADSVTLEDISQNLEKDDESLVEDALSKAVGYCDFDIARFKSMAEYKQAISIATNSDKFYLITNMYSLGEEIYYVRFSTDRSFYNYTLLRKSDSAENGYQILKVRTDCIPLSDYELQNIFETYKRSTLLMKKSSDSLKLSKKTSEGDEEGFKLDIPKIQVEKFIPKQFKFPIVLVGGGLALAVLLAVWIIIMRINKDD